MGATTETDEMFNNLLESGEGKSSHPRHLECFWPPDMSPSAVSPLSGGYAQHFLAGQHDERNRCKREDQEAQRYFWRQDLNKGMQDPQADIDPRQKGREM